MLPGTCRECNAQYNSERELRDHMGTAHRKFSPQPSVSVSNDEAVDESAIETAETTTP
jgi:hypothetical protein